FQDAGFITLSIRNKPPSALRVAKHPLAKGYLFKIYLESESPENSFKEQNALVQRCRGAEQVRNLIKKERLKYFTVADKWLYELPKAALTRRKTYVLIVKDMEILEYEQSKSTWLTKPTKKQLKELYLVLKKGYGSQAVITNVPATKYGTYAFI